MLADQLIVLLFRLSHGLLLISWGLVTVSRQAPRIVESSPKTKYTNI